MRKPTIKDLAERLNLSKSTISRVINQDPNVGAETRIAVEKAIQKLGYEPNQVARGFKRKSINLIGVIVPKLEYYFYARAISGIEEEAFRHGYQLMICQSNESMEREIAYVKQFLNFKVAGIIASISGNTSSLEHFLELKDQEIPVIFINRDVPGDHFSSVVIDNFRAGFEATAALIRAGSNRIVYLGGPRQIKTNEDRRNGYLAALKQHNDNDFQLLVETDFQPDFIIKTTEQVLREYQPDAFLCYSDQVAVSAIKAIKKLGYTIPDQVMITGFNNEPANELMDPPLGSVEMPMFEMGKTAAGMLFKCLKHKQQKVEKVMLPFQLILRKSSGIVR